MSEQVSEKTPLELVADEIHFDAAQYWLDGKFDDPEALVAALKDQNGLEDYEDENGNRQGAVRLDPDPEGKDGFWVTVKEGVDQKAIEASKNSYQQKADELAAARQQIVADPVLAAIESATDFDDLKAKIASLKAK